MSDPRSREERLAAALRANLSRRKARARGEAAAKDGFAKAEPPPGPAEPDC